MLTRRQSHGGPGVPGSQDGFTIIELMMATAITLVILATATGTFNNALLLNNAATLIADSNQNVRSGSNAFVRDLMQAGRGIPTGGIPIPSGAGAAALVRPGPPATPPVVLNFNNTTQATLTALTTGYRQGPLIAGRTSPSFPTDIVTLLALDPTSYVAYPALSFKQLTVNIPAATALLPLPTGLTAPVPGLALDGSNLTVGQFSTWISDPVSGIKAGDLLLFINTNGTAIQTVTSVSSTTVFFAAGDPFNFNQRGAPLGSINQIRGGASTVPFPQTDVVRIQMLTYYIDAVTVPGEPRLTRRVNFFAPQGLSGLVDDLAITYDLVDLLVPVYPVDVPSLPATISGKLFGASQVRKANLRIAFRSESKAAAQNDYLRNTTNTVVSMRNLAYFDRYSSSK